MKCIEARDHFLKILTVAQEHRSQKGELVDDPLGGRVPEWQLFERETMLAEVNKWRAERGFDPVDARRLVRVEQLAVGHVDYSNKFALYCGELGCGEN